MQKKNIHIALVGNPNSGKSSLFNLLTGLNQQVGNFPGVTVDKKTGISKISETLSGHIIDLPGTYSLYPSRLDEWVSYRVLMDKDEDVKADVVVLVADASSLKRNLLFCTQIIDLKKPVILALTMLDLAKKKGIDINISELEIELGVPIVILNPRKNKGLSELKKFIELAANNLDKVPVRDFIDNLALANDPIEEIKELFGEDEIVDYSAIHYLINHDNLELDNELNERIKSIKKKHNFNPAKTQAEEIVLRYKHIDKLISKTVVIPDPLQKAMLSEKLDDIFLHRVWGYMILLAVLFLLFQSVFWLAQYPMFWIEQGFANMSSFLNTVLPDNAFSDLLVNGVLAGLSGILIFVPQIMILFGLISILEDTGYMSRISFLSDRLMRTVGLNGKSVMPMISGFACAVPAIMSARNIDNRKERLLTILITPLMSCSARLPVYIIIISLVIPNTYLFGFLNLQGVVMMCMYLMGLVVALMVSYVAKWFIHINERSFFILELPTYRGPRWNNIIQTMINKARIFVVDAGKVIMVISLILWGLSSYGPPKKMKAVTEQFAVLKKQPGADLEKLDKEFYTAKLENSFAGILGKSIEPAIEPLGYDWKIGIALITSFAAREVFVGTMATLYSVGNNDEGGLILREKMKASVRPNGKPRFDLATGLSLMIFYALAMQCMSTLAVVYRETRTWKWPIIQLVYMTGLAYLLSLICYQLLK